MARIHRTVQKELHDQDNHDGVITHLEPDILECEVKWALESITMNKAKGGDGIPVELFQILKDEAVTRSCTYGLRENLLRYNLTLSRKTMHGSTPIMQNKSYLYVCVCMDHICIYTHTYMFMCVYYH